MHLVRHNTAPDYDAPGHAGMAMQRLQGREAGPSDSVWIGTSLIAPGGGTTASAADVEKFYVVLEGELLVIAGTGSGQGREGQHEEQRVVLGPLDSCRIAPGEVRELRNVSAHPCRVLLVMPNA